MPLASATSSLRIPDFTASGILPVGTYPVTFEELRESILVSGPALRVEDAWDGSWRKRLVDNAAVLVGQLRQVGVTEIFLDGSFVEAKPHPNDIDGYFECDPVELARGSIQRGLNAIDPFKVWTWDPRSRRPAAGSTKRQLPMWHHYRVELYPHYPGLLSGICDPFGNELQFPSAFRQQRGTGLQKGIVKIIG
jgi:hypothetical protein